MNHRWRRIVVASAAVALLAGGAAGLDARPEEQQAAAADRQLLERLAEEEAVLTDPSTPGVSAYLAHVVRTLLGGLVGGVGRVIPARTLARWIGGLTLFLLVAALLGILLRSLAWWIGRRHEAPRAGSPAVTVLADEAAERRRVAAEERRRVEALLAAGRIQEALEAVWWWLAVSLAGERADAAWTSRELLARTGRQELAPPVRLLDAWTYGRRRPEVPEVQALVESLEMGLDGARG